jgi:hypothetical protein
MQELVCSYPGNGSSSYATRTKHVIMLENPVKVRLMPDIWVQSVPVTAIPWTRINTEQRNKLEGSIRKDD